MVNSLDNLVLTKAPENAEEGVILIEERNRLPKVKQVALGE